MPRYVDGFVLPIPKKNAAAYRRMAQKAGKIWRDQVASMPFDGKRMIYGGFETRVDL